MTDYADWRKGTTLDPDTLTTQVEPLEVLRGKVYGNPLDNHRRISTLVGAWLGHPVKPSDIAMIMVMVKQSRLAQTPDHADSLDDLEVYLDFYRRFVAAGE
jgi:hypothetical protein